MPEKRPISSGLAKFAGVTVAAALVTTAVTNVYENRNATSEARQAMVRELADTVAAVTTARIISIYNNAPAAYLNTRCADLTDREPHPPAAVKEACDKAGVDELLQEQELGNQERRDLARLGVIAEVAEGQFGVEPASAIRQLETASRLLNRLGNRNHPIDREAIIHDLAQQPGIEISAADAKVLIESVTPQGDVVADQKFQDAFDRASAQVAELTKDATADIRTADVVDRDTSFATAAWHALSDPFILVALIVAVLLYLWSIRKPRGSGPRSRVGPPAELSE